MMKYLATISVILLGCSLDGSSWEMIGILALVSAVLIGAAVVEEDTKRARKHLASAGRKGKVRKCEARRDLRKAG
jgi:uncharacterized lipoprotein YajG